MTVGRRSHQRRYVERPSSRQRLSVPAITDASIFVRMTEDDRAPLTEVVEQRRVGLPHHMIEADAADRFPRWS